MIKSVNRHREKVQVDNLWSVSIGKKTYTVNGMGQQVVYLQIPWFFGVLLYLNKLSFFLLQNITLSNIFFFSSFSAGIGRTGVLITMETAMCLIEANQPVYPLSIVRQMRDQRAMLIQTAVSVYL